MKGANKKLTRIVVSILTLLCLFFNMAVPSLAMNEPVLPRTARDTRGNEVTYSLTGTTLTIKQTKHNIDECDSVDMKMVLYPFLTSCSKENQDIILALDYGLSPILVFSLSDYVRSGKIKTIDYLEQIYTFTVKDGLVTKVKIDFGENDIASASLKYSDGKFVSYLADYGVDREDVEIKYDHGQMKSGETGEPYIGYDFTCTRKDGNLEKENKDVMTSAGPYTEDYSFTFTNGRVDTVTVDMDEPMYFHRENRRERYFYNADGTISSVDFLIITEKYDETTGETTESTRTDTYYAYTY